MPVQHQLGPGNAPELGHHHLGYQVEVSEGNKVRNQGGLEGTSQKEYLRLTHWHLRRVDVSSLELREQELANGCIVAVRTEEHDGHLPLFQPFQSVL